VRVDSKRVKIRRSPFVVSYWLGPALVFENYATHRRSAGNALVVEVLGFCGDGKSFPELRERFPELGESGLRNGIRQLLKNSLLEVWGKESRATDRKWAGWERWNPAAGFFHCATKDPEFHLNEGGDFRGLSKIARVRPLPPRMKKYARAASVPLPKVDAAAEFVRVLQGRRTWRQFATKPVKRKTLAQLLWLSFGVQGWAKVSGVGRLVFRTSPSGGAMQPMEAYVFVRNVRGLREGIYHYNAAENRLELLREGTGKAEIATMLAGQRWAGEAAFVVFLTAVFGRTQWKYEHPRAYRVVLAEAGHLGQTFCLTATWLGLAPFCTMALADTKIERALGIDGVSESVLYALGAGERPRQQAPAERVKE